MVMNLKIIFLCLLVSVFLILIADAQTSNQTNRTDDYWLNISSCPLKINVRENKPPLMNLFLENTSQGTIINYQLGCVTEEDKVIKIKNEKKIEEIEIKSATTNDNIIYLPKSAHGNYLSTMCKLSEKVAVINVNFADGGTWTLKR